MFRYVLAFVIGLPTFANAQSFYTVQSCGPSQEQFQPSIDSEETPLFVGTSIVIAANGVPYQGGMMFTVNQDTGTWTMFTAYADGTVCVVAFGDYFEPAQN